MKYLFLILFPSLAFGQFHRWDVKSLTDKFVAPKTAKNIKVSDLEKLPIIKVGTSTPRLDEEKQLITVRALIAHNVRHNEIPLQIGGIFFALFTVYNSHP